jgi:hypothetical protein
MSRIDVLAVSVVAADVESWVVMAGENETLKLQT